MPNISGSTCVFFCCFTCCMVSLHPSFSTGADPFHWVPKIILEPDDISCAHQLRNLDYVPDSMLHSTNHITLPGSNLPSSCKLCYGHLVRREPKRGFQQNRANHQITHSRKQNNYTQAKHKYRPKNIFKRGGQIHRRPIFCLSVPSNGNKHTFLKLR